MSASALDFGQAIRALKSGQRVARAGWDGWIFLVRSIRGLPEGGTTLAVYRLTTLQAEDSADALPWVALRTPDDKAMPWNASQADMLAEDWCLVEH